MFTQDLWSLLFPSSYGLTYRIYTGSVELAVAKLTIFNQDLWSLLLPSFYGLTYHIYTGSGALAVAKFLRVNLPYLHRIWGPCCCQVSISSRSTNFFFLYSFLFSSFGIWRNFSETNYFVITIMFVFNSGFFFSILTLCMLGNCVCFSFCLLFKRFSGHCFFQINHQGKTVWPKTVCKSHQQQLTGFY